MIDQNKLYDKINRYESIIGCFIVSESPHYPKTTISGMIVPTFPVINDQASRYHNLVKCREKSEKIWGKADLCLYIDDNSMYKHDASKAGFIFVDAEQFANMFGVKHV